MKKLHSKESALNHVMLQSTSHGPQPQHKLTIILLLRRRLRRLARRLVRPQHPDKGVFGWRSSCRPQYPQYTRVHTCTRTKQENNHSRRFRRRRQSRKCISARSSSISAPSSSSQVRCVVGNEPAYVARGNN